MNDAGAAEVHSKTRLRTAQADVVAKHRVACPGDRLLGVARGAGGRRRLK
jgi:hypothetical protein